MGNHEWCQGCDRNDYHNDRPCDPEDVAKHLKITVAHARVLRQCQPLVAQSSYREPEKCCGKCKHMNNDNTCQVMLDFERSRSVRSSDQIKVISTVEPNWGRLCSSFSEN